MLVLGALFLCLGAAWALGLFCQKSARPPQCPTPPGGCIFCGPENPYRGEDTLLLADTVTLQYVNVGPRLRSDGLTAPALGGPPAQDQTYLSYSPAGTGPPVSYAYRAGPPWLLAMGLGGQEGCAALVQQHQNSLLLIPKEGFSRREQQKALEASCCQSCAHTIWKSGQRYLLYDCLEGAPLPLPGEGSWRLRGFGCQRLLWGEQGEVYLLSFAGERPLV